MPNPNIAAAGKNTRFQNGNGAAKDRNTKPSFRNALRRIAGMTIPDVNDKKFFTELIANAPTGLDMLAAMYWKRAFTNDRMLRKLIRIIDGPTPTAEQVARERANGTYYK